MISLGDWGQFRVRRGPLCQAALPAFSALGFEAEILESGSAENTVVPRVSRRSIRSGPVDGQGVRLRHAFRTKNYVSREEAGQLWEDLGIPLCLCPCFKTAGHDNEDRVWSEWGTLSASTLESA